MTAQPIRAIDLDAGIIEGLAIPFGGPMGGKDLYDTTFTAETNLYRSWFPAGRPLLYQHGNEDGTRADPVGRQFGESVRDDGVWIQAQLDKANRYAGLIGELVEQGVLYFSSGAMPHLVKQTRDGVITDWPWIETSLTPEPVNPYAVVDAVRAIDHYKAVGLYFPDAARTLDETDLDAAAVEAARKALESEPTAPDPIEGLWLAWVQELSRRA